jgi:hypothetical protein
MWKTTEARRGSWKRAAVQRRLEQESRGIAIVRSCNQANASEDTAGWKIFSLCSSELQIVDSSDGAIIKCSYEWCVKVTNKFNFDSKPPSRVILILRGNIAKILLKFVY